nr:glycosyltransferase [Prolixibacteraceae bacterium]
NVAEDHQTKNARALVDKGAAIMIPDAEAVTRLIPEALELLGNPVQLKHLSENIERLAKPDAASDIAERIIQLAAKND